MPGLPYDTDRVFTLPNVLTFLRLLGVPLFLWLILGPHWDGWAFVVLAIGGATDFLDGYLARRWRQISRIGQMLDPVADRTYIAAALLGLALRGIIPWWLVGVLVARDLCMALLIPLLKTRGYTSLPVHFLGKMATFFLLYAFPAILLGDGPTSVDLVFRVAGWACAIWGTALYWWAGLLYVRQAIWLVTAPRRATP